MPTVNLTYTLAGGQVENINQVQQNFVDLRTGINGNLDGDNLTTVARQSAGLNSSSAIQRGSSIVPTLHTTTSTTYTTLSVPDQVSNIVLPSNGYITVLYEAHWTGPTTTSRAAIFLNNNQLTNPTSISVTLQEATKSDANEDILKTTVSSAGLDSLFYSSSVVADQTTGQTFNGVPVHIRAAAGTYTVSVRFKNTAGASVGVSSRYMFVEARAW